MKNYFLKLTSFTLLFSVLFSLNAMAHTAAVCYVAKAVKKKCHTHEVDIPKDTKHFIMINQLDYKKSHQQSLESKPIQVKYKLFNKDSGKQLHEEVITGSTYRNWPSKKTFSKAVKVYASIEILDGDDFSPAMIYVRGTPCPDNNKNYNCRKPLAGYR